MFPREAWLLLLGLFAPEQYVVLEHEQQVEDDGESPQTKLGRVSKYGLPVICSILKMSSYVGSLPGYGAPFVPKLVQTVVFPSDSV